MIAVLLVTVMVHECLIAQTAPQSPVQTQAKMQQILRKAHEKDKAVNVTLKKKIENRKKLSGKVSDISETGFVVTDQKTRTSKELAYEDVQEIHQKGLSKSAEIAIGVGILAAVVLVIFAAVYPKT